MADHSKIEWTEATWNPVVGCSVVSPGCTNCYAMKDAWRKNSNPRIPRYHGLTKMTKGGPVWTGEVRTVPQLLDWPLRKRKPLRIFVNSMSDLFHEDVDAVFIGSVLGIASACPQHIFQVLTKRAARMLDMLQSVAFLEAYEASQDMYTDTVTPWPAPNVWLGVSVEDQRRADERIPLLQRTPAAVRWISAEPLLQAIDLTDIRTFDEGHTERGHLHELADLDWVVGGGESGPGARPFNIAWARSLRDQCRAAGVPFFLKQLGRCPLSDRDEGYPWAELYDDAGKPIGEWGLDGTSAKGGDPEEWPQDLRVREYPA